MYKKQQNLFLKTYVVLPVVCLHLVVPEWIAHTHNAFGILLLYVAHHDKEFVEILESGHWFAQTKLTDTLISTQCALHFALRVLSQLSFHCPLFSSLVNS